MKTRIITVASIVLICLLLSVLCYVELGSFNFISTGLALSKTPGQEGVYQIADRPERVFLVGTENALENFRLHLEQEGYTLRLDQQMGSLIPVEKDGRLDYVHWSVNAMYHKFRWETVGEPAPLPTDGADEAMTLSIPETLTGSAYFYPEADLDVTALAEPDVTFRYPAAETFSTESHRRLYWEGHNDMGFAMDEGFCVAAADTAAFLEDALKKLGLTAREREDLLIACLPRMQESGWNLISFQTYAPLEVSPEPDTAMSICLLFQPLDAPVNIPPQTHTAPAREGFAVVQWCFGQVN